MRTKLTYANVVSTLCLFILLGGTAYATLSLPKNSVGPKQLKPSSVTGPKVKNGSIAAADLKQNAIAALVQATSYTKTESDARYLRGTVVETKSFKLGEGSGESSSKEVACPAGYQAVGGGVDTSNTGGNILVTASTPTFNGSRPEQSIGEGEHKEGPANGWFGAIARKDPAGPGVSGFDEVSVICSPLG